jgi:uncharacterized repeat protein (TIGR03803 family)
MRSSRSSLDCLPVAFVVILVLAGQSFAQFNEEVVYKFLGRPDGSRPAATLVGDAAGNLYGTTADGGIEFSCCGTIFGLSPPAIAGGSWAETVLYQFQGGSDGATPLGTLFFDKLGNLYGTTGGAGDNAVGSTIFELSSPSTPEGVWTKATLFSFSGNQYLLSGKMVMDAAGNLYGTSEGGGSHNKGIVFELVAPKTAGTPWAERVLYNFHAFASDGVGPGGTCFSAGVSYMAPQKGAALRIKAPFSV